MRALAFVAILTLVLASCGDAGSGSLSTNNGTTGDTNNGTTGEALAFGEPCVEFESSDGPASVCEAPFVCTNVNAEGLPPRVMCTTRGESCGECPDWPAADCISDDDAVGSSDRYCAPPGDPRYGEYEACESDDDCTAPLQCFTGGPTVKHCALPCAVDLPVGNSGLDRSSDCQTASQACSATPDYPEQGAFCR